LIHKLYIEPKLKIKNFVEDKQLDVLRMYEKMYSGQLVKIFVYSVIEKRVIEIVTNYTADVLGLDDNKIRSTFLVDMDYKTMSSSLIETKTYVFSPNSALSYQQTLFKLQDVANTVVERGKIPVVTVFDMREGKKPLTITANIFGVKGPYNCYVPIFSCSRGAGGDGVVDSTVSNLANDDAEQGVRRLVGSVDLESGVYTLTKNGVGLYQLPGMVNLNSQRVDVTIAQTKSRKVRFFVEMFKITTKNTFKIWNQGDVTTSVINADNCVISHKVIKIVNQAPKSIVRHYTISGYAISISNNHTAVINGKSKINYSSGFAYVVNTDSIKIVNQIAVYPAKRFDPRDGTIANTNIATYPDESTAKVFHLASHVAVTTDGLFKIINQAEPKIMIIPVVSTNVKTNSVLVLNQKYTGIKFNIPVNSFALNSNATHIINQTGIQKPNSVINGIILSSDFAKLINQKKFMER